MTAIDVSSPRTQADSGSARRARLVPAMPGPAWLRWVSALLLGAFAAVLRLTGLGQPPQIYFDETYYAKDAFGLREYGYERETVEYPDERAEETDLADQLLNGGDTDIFTDGGSMVVHPPLGKWMLAAGDSLWGLLPFGEQMTPYGWRFAAALIGALSVVLLVMIATRMTRSILLGSAAGLIMSLDGLHFTLSRIAMVDIFLTFWILAGFACLVVDRDRTRARLVGLADQGMVNAGWLGMRWWRLAAGVCFGLACGTKWSAVFFLAVFGLLTVAWDYGARRAVGQHRPMSPWILYRGVPVGVRGVLPRWFVFDAAPAFVAMVGGALVTYLVTWSGWLFSSGGYHRGWSASEPLGFWEFLPNWLLPPFDALRSLWHYHVEILRFHSGLSSEHDYMSMPWDWLILRIPVVFHFDNEVTGCDSGDCVRTVLSLGTPVVWWLSLASLVVVAAWWLTFRDWRAGAVLLAVAAGVLPWFAFPDRTMFLFYALPVLPFLILGLVLTLGLILGPVGEEDGPGQLRRVVGGIVFGVTLLLVVANFAYLYPVLSAQIIDREVWAERMWFTTWIHGDNGSE